MFMKIVNISASIIIGIMLFIVLLFTSVEVIGYNINYYEWQYERHNIPDNTKMSINELLKVTSYMIDYLQGERQSLEMTAIIDGSNQEVFGEREKQHMIDVKKLFTIGSYLRNISLYLLVIIFIYMIYKNKTLLIVVLSNVKYVFGTIIMLILILGGLLISNFNKYFTIFHKIFFSNDLWLLDPKTDILINIVPEIFFFQTAMIILGLFTISVIILLSIIKIWKNRYNRADYN